MYIDALYKMQGDGDVYLNDYIEGIGVSRLPYIDSDKDPVIQALQQYFNEQEQVIVHSLAYIQDVLNVMGQIGWRWDHEGGG